VTTSGAAIKNQVSVAAPIDAEGNFTARLRPARYSLGIGLLNGVDETRVYPFIVQDVVIESGVTKRLSIRNPGC